MTYNIRLDTAVDGQDSWSHRRNWVTAQIDWLRPDIFGLQEVVINQKRDIAFDLPHYQLVGKGRDDGKDAGESSPIGFDTRRFELKDNGTFWLSPTPDRPSKGWDAAYPRVATWARLQLRGGNERLLVMNTHWDNIGTEARLQSGFALRKWLAANQRAGERIVLLGDFNTQIDSPAMQALTSLQSAPHLRDARKISRTIPFGPQGTFNGFKVQPETVSAIDHVLVGEGIKVNRYAVFAQVIDGHVPSDHYPVLADFSLTPNCKGKLLLGEQQAVPASGGSYPYLRFVPKGYAKDRKRAWPLLLFLHGSGERGSDLDLVRVHGPPRIVAEKPDFPFIVISPQLEADGDWDLGRLDSLLRQVRKDYRIDASRIYLTGLSRGGHATWRWAAAEPGLFAAIAPVAGRGDPATACALGSMPVWAFHGANDNIVPPSGSIDMVNAINHCGGAARLTVYPEANHDSWTQTYANPDLYDWILQQHRKGGR